MAHNAVANYAHLAATLELAILDNGAGNGSHLADVVYLLDLGVANDFFLDVGREHTFHGALNLLDCIVDD